MKCKSLKAHLTQYFKIVSLNMQLIWKLKIIETVLGTVLYLNFTYSVHISDRQDMLCHGTHV